MTRIHEILAAGPYYHVTPRCRADLILQQGLLPSNPYSQSYTEILDVRGPIICLAAAAFKDQYVEAIRDHHLGEVVVRLEIHAPALAGLRVELDPTTTEYDWHRRRLGTDDFGALLRAGVPLISYDAIPPSAIREEFAWPPKVTLAGP